MRRAFVLAAAVLVAASGLVLAPAPPASAAAPFCGITWGSLPRSIEHSRLPGFRSLVAPREVHEVTGPRDNNKFLMVQVDL